MKKLKKLSLKKEIEREAEALEKEVSQDVKVPANIEIGRASCRERVSSPV